MALTLNSITVTTNKLNSVDVDTEKLNGVTVYTKAVPKTATPAIQNMSDTTIKYRVRNADNVIATIYSDYNQTNPTTNRGSIASGSYTSIINTGFPTMFGASVTVYAKAQASGKEMSNINSMYFG